MTDIDRIAALLHENHLGCRLDYRGDWDCDGPARHRQMASRIAAGVTLAPTPPDAAIDHRGLLWPSSATDGSSTM